ncbi:MAG: TonB family protein [Desulfobulbaceae bacterium]|nr:TonB family protein [Desulfobulbaceae bacterium]
MNAQLKGNSFSLMLHALLLIGVWSVNAQMQVSTPPLLLDLNILPGMEALAETVTAEVPTPGPPAELVQPAQPQTQETAEAQAIKPSPLVEPMARKKVVRKKIAPPEQVEKRVEPLPVQERAVVQPGAAPASTPAANPSEQGSAKSVASGPSRSSQQRSIYSSGEIDGALTALKRGQPAYPPSARRRNIEGWVQVQFIVNEHGQPEQIRILAAEPEGVFDASVVNSISRWRFRPGMVKGAAVRVLVEQTIRFQLR